MGPLYTDPFTVRNDGFRDLCSDEGGLIPSALVPWLSGLALPVHRSLRDNPPACCLLHARCNGCRALQAPYNGRDGVAAGCNSRMKEELPNLEEQNKVGGCGRKTQASCAVQPVCPLRGR